VGTGAERGGGGAEFSSSHATTCSIRGSGTARAGGKGVRREGARKGVRKERVRREG